MHHETGVYGLEKGFMGSGVRDRDMSRGKTALGRGKSGMALVFSWQRYPQRS